MKRADQLEQIKRIALLIQDRDLARLGAASAQKAQTESQLAALNKTRVVAGPDLAGLDPMICARVADRFGLWTTHRRIMLNQKLARETVTWMAAKNEAKLAFGRAKVLGKLLAKR